MVRSIDLPSPRSQESEGTLRPRGSPLLEGGLEGSQPPRQLHRTPAGAGIVNSIVLLIIYLWYIHKNSIKFFNKNKIELNQSFLLGSITTLWYFGLIAITIVAMGLMEELVSLTGPVALLYLLPLIVGLTLAHKSYSWIKSLLKFVVRKNLPERVRTKLIENKED